MSPFRRGTKAMSPSLGTGLYQYAAAAADVNMERDIRKTASPGVFMSKSEFD